MIRKSIFIASACIAGSAAFGQASAGTPVAAGHELAVEACSACHQVDAQQKRPPPVAEGEEGAHTEAPTFMEIAERCLSASDLRTRIANPHYPMREQTLMPIDLDNLSFYIRSLSHKSNCVTNASSH
jgi:hypothetical protein